MTVMTDADCSSTAADSINKTTMAVVIIVKEDTVHSWYVLSLASRRQKSQHCKGPCGQRQRGRQATVLHLSAESGRSLGLITGKKS